jgi:hypothetical protein
MIIPGSIRVAIKTKKRIKIVTTSIFKGVSDGGGLNIYDLAPKPITDDVAESHIDDPDTPVSHAYPNAESPVIVDSDSDASDHRLLADTTDDTADVAAILAHKGKPKKRTKMQFQVRWKGYNETHDQWLPWSELKNNWVLHN